MPSAHRRFKFLHCLGRGSFGEVYAATMRSRSGLESQVAVKLLRADLDLQGEAVRRLRDEGRVLSKLSHPAILRVVDLVTLQGRLALITEHVEGADLSDFIKVRLPVRALLQAIGQVAGALDAACAATGDDGPLQLVHRDVKPSNVRLDKHGQAKLLDFGIARFHASDREVRTASDLVVGSIPYMAPERFVQRGVEPSSDVFSLGCTLFEGISGDRFYGTTQVAKITGLALQPDRYEVHARERIAALPVAAGVRQLLTELLRLDPASRPTAGAVAARLDALADQIGGPTLRMWCREQVWEPRRLSGALDGQTLDEGELAEPEPPPSRAPVVHLAPRPTLEPGTASPWAPEVASDAAFDPPTGDTPTRVDRAPAPPPSPPPRPPPSDSVWERPYSVEAPRPRPADPEPAPEALGAPESTPVARRGGRLGLALGVVGALGVLAGIGAVIALVGAALLIMIWTS